MRKIDHDQVAPRMPLTDKDMAALDAIFETVEVEEIRHIEATVVRYCVVPPDPWEEQGWVANSYLPILR
ncbi:MAG TPA: hypothetical protein DCE56_35815 [Cyanobacteria bacterium UBA8553]|nr:hypothetical protein [Cyanobacteria bacterium UBA8553]